MCLRRRDSILRPIVRLAARCALAPFVALAALSCAQGAGNPAAPIIDRTPRAEPPRRSRMPSAPCPPARRHEPLPAATDRAQVVTAPLAEPGADQQCRSLRVRSARADPRPRRPIASRSSFRSTSPAYARAAEAVRDGFLAAAEAAGAKDKCVVIGHKDDGVLAAFDEARARGVRVVVGPLLRDDLKTLAIADRDSSRGRSRSTSSTTARRCRRALLVRARRSRPTRARSRAVRSADGARADRRDRRRIRR